MQHTSMMKINSSNQAFTLWHLAPVGTRGCPRSQHMLKMNTQHISSSTNKTFIDWGRDSLVAVISWNDLIWMWYHQEGFAPPNNSGFTHCETLSSSHTTVNPSENNEDLQHAGKKCLLDHISRNHCFVHFYHVDDLAWIEGWDIEHIKFSFPDTWWPSS